MPFAYLAAYRLHCLIFERSHKARTSANNSGGFSQCITLPLQPSSACVQSSADMAKHAQCPCIVNCCTADLLCYPPVVCAFLNGLSHVFSSMTHYQFGIFKHESMIFPICREKVHCNTNVAGAANARPAVNCESAKVSQLEGWTDLSIL